MKQFALLAAFLVASACGSLGPAQAHTLSLAYKTGDTYRYAFHSATRQTVNMGGQTLPTQIDIKAAESVKVNSVDPNGTADLTITFNNVAFKSEAAGITNTTTGLPADTMDLTIAADGTISTVDGSPIEASNPIAGFTGVGGGFFITAVLPNHPVKPGDTWSKTYDQTLPASFINGGSHITSASSYLRDESLNGVNAAVVETKSSGTITITGKPAAGSPDGGLNLQGTFTTDVTTWIDPSGHRVMKSHGTAHDDATIKFSGLQTAPARETGPSPLPALQGPLTSSGDSTTDLAPA